MITACSASMQEFISLFPNRMMTFLCGTMGVSHNVAVMKLQEEA